MGHDESENYSEKMFMFQHGPLLAIQIRQPRSDLLRSSALYFLRFLSDLLSFDLDIALTSHSLF
jgi:hypothetical protein